MESSGQDHRIVVTGRAERRVKPDRAEWSISVEAADPDERAAFETCSSRASDLLAGLREVGGEDAEIATAWVRVAPRWDSERKRHVGYAASTAVTVACDLDRAGAVARRAMVDGVQGISGPEFKVSDPEPTKLGLLADAIDAARRKAERIAAAADRRLGRVMSVREGQLEWRPGGGILLDRVVAADLAEPEIVADDQTVAVDLVATFELDD